MSITSTLTPGTDFGMTMWSSLNPFDEPTSYVLLHPHSAEAQTGLARAAAELGLKRLDEDGDIMPLMPDKMFVSLRARQVELCVGGNVWVHHPVSDDWTGNAVGRRYVVFIIGTDLLEDDSDPETISAYLKQRERIYASLLKIRLRVEST